MNPRTTRLLTGATLALLASLPAAQAKVGDTPAYTFRSEVLAGGGLESLADLRGRPVLIDFWGTRCGPCVNFAVPSAIELAEEYGDDLVVLLVECQGASADQIASFALGKKWHGTHAMWTTERVFDLGLRGIPHSALLSPEGEIVLAGYTQEIHGELEDKIAELVSAAKEAPEGTPKSLTGAWKDFGKGKYAKAFAAVNKVLAKEGHADAAAAGETLAEFRRRLDLRLRRVAWQIESGRVHHAQTEIETLTGELKADADLAQRLAELTASIEANEMELDAAKKVASLEAKLFADGPNEKLTKQLAEVAEKYAGTKSALHAARLASWASA